MFKIYEVKLTKFGASAYAFLTSYRNPGGHLKGESFCFLPEAGKSPLARRLKCEFRDLEDKSFEFNENTMIELARDETELLINQYITEHYMNKEWALSSNGVSYGEVDDRHLCRLQLRGAADFISTVAGLTECDELKELLESIMKLPTVTSKPMPL